MTQYKPRKSKCCRAERVHIKRPDGSSVGFACTKCGKPFEPAIPVEETEKDPVFIATGKKMLKDAKEHFKGSDVKVVEGLPAETKESWEEEIEERIESLLLIWGDGVNQITEERREDLKVFTLHVLSRLTPIIAKQIEEAEIKLVKELEAKFEEQLEEMKEETTTKLLEFLGRKALNTAASITDMNKLNEEQRATN